MDPAKYEYQSEFAKHYLAQGIAQGRAQGQAALFMKLLALKFGALTAETTARVQQASAEELDRWAERLLNAASIDDVLA